MNSLKSKCSPQVHITIMCVAIVVLDVVSSASVNNFNHIHDDMSKNVYRNVSHKKTKYTIEELLSTRFESKISNDIDVDPCKSGAFMGDIALSNVQYDTEWQQPQIHNKSFQQELLKLKQEVYNEGLQVEEEGMTDIMRKKTKLPVDRMHQRNRNDPIVVGVNDDKSYSEKLGIPTSEATIPTTEKASISTAGITQVDNDAILPDATPSSVSLDLEEEKAKLTNTNNNFRHIDVGKIQSDTKDISDISGDNIIMRKKAVVVIPTVPPTTRTTLPSRLSNSGGNSTALESVQLLIPDGVVRKRHRKRRQGRHFRSKTHSNEEHNKHDDEMNVKERHHREARHIPYVHLPAGHIDEVLSKKMTTLRSAEMEIITSLSDVETSDDSQRLDSLSQHHRIRRAATAKKERIWDYGVIPYEIDGNFSGAHKALFKQAMRHWENFTCIKFVERNLEDHSNYILFTIRPCGCCSFVGKRGNGAQAISIGKNCDKFGIVVHELGHVVGFWHEHTRPDREKHVTIERTNIMMGQDYNFNMLTGDDVDSLGLPYDYDSIMHYARNTFSKGTYLDTILPIEVKGMKRPEIGQRLRLSDGDISQANMLYKCPKCGRTFQNNSGSFTSPSFYPSTPLSDPERCEWRITATHGEKIILNITDLDIYNSTDCRTDYLEVRDGYWHKSPLLGRFCGNKKIPEIIRTEGSRMLLTYTTTYRQAGRRGFSANFEAICGGDLNLETGGRLESPNYPLDYMPNKECVWRLTVPENYQVALRFQSFEVENHDNCVYDYVEIRDGDSNDSRLIGVFCGFKVPPDIRSTSNKMFVKFVSDGSVQKAGFSATFMKELDECDLQDHGCEHECINTLGGYECTCFIGFELHSDKKRCENACGGVIEALNGTFTSPSFPNVYPVSKECVWEIIAPEQHKITLNFTHFELEGNGFPNQACDYDSLKVFSKIGEDNLKKHGIYCGNRQPGIITSETNVMRVEFRSDNSIQHSGFAAFFITDIDECAVNNGGCQHDCRNTIGTYTCGCHNGYTLQDNGHDCMEGGCKYEIIAPNGQIYSPNYPDNYPSRKDCVWHFTTTPGHRIKLAFVVFEVEPHQECHYDHVTIYDGDSHDSMTLGLFCGYKLPHSIAASSNQMYMVFKSDVSVEAKGFTALHTTVCGGFLKATTRVKHFYSHARFGDQNYNAMTDCDWTIAADDGRNVQLSFLTFDIEHETHCSYDYVEVFSGLDDVRNEERFGRFCGSETPQDIISLNEALIVRFRSDETTMAKGFSVSYVAVDPLESEDLTQDSLEYATPFPGSLKSQYIIDGTSGEDLDEDEDVNEYGYVLYKTPHPHKKYKNDNHMMSGETYD